MKKITLLLLFVVLSLSSLAAQQKYALVIGNGAYTGITRLNNPVNDANDISAALRDLGFTVDQVTNADLMQMEEAVTRLKNRLAAARGSYGFFYYAGHGVQSNGENYLIPVNANIPSEAYLRNRAVSMPVVLDELNAAGNTLNIVVLDACRDNPFSWRRSGTRGLQVVSNQPADSIIVYATSAGSTAADGIGRNGLFTTHLLNNLKKPGLSVRDLFDQTGADVRRASNNVQVPAIYSQFFDVAYLGTRPAVVTPAPSPAPVQPAPNPTPVPARNARSYFDSGQLFRSQGDYVTAIEEYTQAIRLDPNYVAAYHGRGLAYRNKNDNDRAIADYTQAIRFDPNYAVAYTARGNAYSDKGDHDRAIADYTQAIRLDPNYAAAYTARGNAYYSKGDYDTAIADHTQAIRLDPNKANAYHNRGSAYERKGENDRAFADYDLAIRLDPNFAGAYIGRGTAYRNKGDNDRAIADYTQAIRIDPNYTSAYYNRGSAYYMKRDYNRAIADYEAALQLDPNHANAREFLGKSRQARGY
jgi:tetratricopeptide (TPR) repeat protein